MEHLPKKTCQNGISYTLVGDYYIPDLQLPEERGCCTRKKSKCSSLFTLKCLQKHKNARHRPQNFQKVDNSNRPF